MSYEFYYPSYPLTVERSERYAQDAAVAGNQRPDPGEEEVMSEKQSYEDHTYHPKLT